MSIGQPPPAVPSSTSELVDGFNDVKINVREPRVEGTSVFLDFDADGGGDIPFRYGGKAYSYDCTTGLGPGGIGSVELIQGTLEEPMWQFVYLQWSENDQAAVAVTSQRIPVGVGFGPVAYCNVPAYTDVSANQVVMIQRVTDIPGDGYRSSASYLREKVRLALTNNRITGGEVELTITTNAGARDNVNVRSSVCQFYQLHEQEMAEQDSSVEGIRMVGQDIGECTIGNYSVITDLGLLTETGNGTTITDGDSISIDIIGIGNSCGLPMLGAVVSKLKHAAVADAIEHAQVMANMRYPKDIDQVCFTLARLVLTYSSADSGTWANALAATTTIWKSETIAEATPGYPTYDNNVHQYFGTTHTKTGAIAIRCHFRDFETEANYDYVRLRNAAGTNIFSYHGSLGTFTSANMGGDTIRFYFDSDGSVKRNGAYIDKIEWQEVISTGGGEVIDRR